MRLSVPAALLATVILVHEGDDPVSAWYRSLLTPYGTSCCNMQDCMPVNARVGRDGWEIEMLWPGHWVPVPMAAVLNRENLDGRPIGCISHGQILCFVPPAGT